MKKEQEVIKLTDIVKEWDQFRSECMENMFNQFKYGRKCAFQESYHTYMNAIDMHTNLYLTQVTMRYKK